MAKQKSASRLLPYYKRYRLPPVVIRLMNFCEFLWVYLMMVSLSTWSIAITMFTTIQSVYLANVHNDNPLASSCEQILGVLSNTSLSRISHGIGIIYAVLFIIVNVPMSLYWAWVSSKISIVSFSGHFIFWFIHSGPDIFDGLMLASGVAILSLIAWQFVASTFVDMGKRFPGTSNSTKSPHYTPKESESKPGPPRMFRSNKPPGAEYVTVRPKDPFFIKNEPDCDCPSSKSGFRGKEAGVVIRRLEMELKEERKRVNGSRGEWVVEREGLLKEIKRERGHFVQLQRKCKDLEADLHERESPLLALNREAKEKFDELTRQAQEKYDKLLDKFKKEKAAHQRLRDSADPILQANIDLNAKLRTIDSSHQRILNSYRHRVVAAETRFGDLRRTAEHWEDRARFHKERRKIYAERLNLAQWENRRYKAVERRLRKREKLMQHALEDGTRHRETVTQLKTTVNELLPQVIPLPLSPLPKDIPLPRTPIPAETIPLPPSPPSSPSEETAQTSILLANSNEKKMNRREVPKQDISQLPPLPENPKEYGNQQQSAERLNRASVQSNMNPEDTQALYHTSAASENSLDRSVDEFVQGNIVAGTEAKVKTRPFDFEAARARILSGQAARDTENASSQLELPVPMQICDPDAEEECPLVEEMPMEITTEDQDQDIVLEDAIPEEFGQIEDVAMNDAGAVNQCSVQEEGWAMQDPYETFNRQSGDAWGQDTRMCDIGPSTQPMILDFNRPMLGVNGCFASKNSQGENTVFGDLQKNVVPEATMQDYSEEEQLLQEIQVFLNSSPARTTKSQGNLSNTGVIYAQQQSGPRFDLGNGYEKQAHPITDDTHYQSGFGLENGYVNGYGDQSHILAAAKALFQNNAPSFNQGFPSTARATSNHPNDVPRTTRESLNSLIKPHDGKFESENHPQPIAGMLMKEILQEEEEKQKAAAVPKTYSLPREPADWDEDSEDEFQFMAAMNRNPMSKNWNVGRSNCVAQPDLEDPDDTPEAEAQFMAEIRELLEKQKKLTAAEQGDLSTKR